jgi:electron transfer DM13
MGSAAQTPRFLTIGGRLLLTLVVVAVLVLGIWLAGGVLTNDFTASLVLTAAWMGAAGLACLLLALRRRELRLPLLGAYALVAIAAAVWLGRAELFDKTVHENVVKATPPSSSSRDTSTPAARNVLVSRGGFDSLEHESSGLASVIRTRNGKRVLTLTRFSTSNGPDLRVYLVAGPVADAGDVHDFADLGALKGNKGDQQYELKGKALDRRYRTVVIWCRAFSVGFARARLSPE